MRVFLNPGLVQEKEVWRAVGRVDDFQVGSVTGVKFKNAETVPWEGFASETLAYLEKLGDTSFRALSANCTHLGCIVRWEPGPQLFFCPCHGGTYYKDGTNAGGPPPKPLVNFATRVTSGEVEVRTHPLPITRISAGG